MVGWGLLLMYRMCEKNEEMWCDDLVYWVFICNFALICMTIAHLG